MSISPLRAVLVSLLAFAVAGCWPSGAPDTLVFETDHFAFYGPEGYVCDGLGERLEEHYDVYTALIGTEPANARPLRYFYMPDGAEPACDGAAACIDRRDVFSFKAPDAYQLARAYTRPLGLPPPVFTEGVAVLYGESSTLDADVVVDRDFAIEDILTLADFRVAQADSDIDPTALASFGDYLVRRHGWDGLVPLWMVDQDADGAEVRRAFSEDLGQDLDEALADWRGEPQQLIRELLHDRTTCSQAPALVLAAEGAGSTLDLSPSCGDGPTTRTFRGVPAVGGRLKVAVEEKTFVRITQPAEEGPYVRVAGCAGEPGAEIHLESGVDRWLELGAAEYAAWLEWTEPDPLPLEFSQRPALMGSTCDDVVVQSLEESRSWWTQRVREHFPETWVRFELSSEKYGALIGTLPHDSELCVGRCGDLSCETWRTWDGRVATGLPDLRKLYGGLVYTLHIEPIGTLPELKVGLALLDPS